MFTVVSEHFVYAFSFFCLFKVSYCISSLAFIQACVCVWEVIFMVTIFDFQHAVELHSESFYCDELLLSDLALFLYLIFFPVDISWVLFWTAADRVLT